MIKITNLSKSYDKRKNVVNNINLEINKGDLFGFIGHNGAGKTTTIKALVGIHDYTGSIKINGKELRDNELELKKIMAYIPDNPEVYENLTAIQYLNFVSDIYNVDTKTRTELINKYAREFEIDGSLNAKLSSYSHGMKQKIALIAAFTHQPDILVLDEPFVGLDPKASFAVKKVMAEFCAQGKIIIFSTHVLEVAQKICNKIAIIKRGEIVLEGETSVLTEEKSLEELFMENVDE